MVWVDLGTEALHGRPGLRGEPLVRAVRRPERVPAPAPMNGVSTAEVAEDGLRQAHAAPDGVPRGRLWVRDPRDPLGIGFPAALVANLLPPGLCRFVVH